MKYRAFFSFIAAFLMVLQGSLQAQQREASVNINESRVNWTGMKPTGEHVGYVKLLSGELLQKNNDITGGSFVIDLNSITNTDIKDETSNGRLVGHLKSADFFDVAKFPSAKFVITKINRLPVTGAAQIKATHKVEGNLTMKGITKKISFEASINVLNGKVSATSQPFTIDRTQWGVNYQSKSIFAELKDQFIHDEITLTIDMISN